MTTVQTIIDDFGAEVLSLPESDRTPCGVYCGDLLSWVMGHAVSDNVWVTVMTNLNVVAVASLADVSCVIITDGSEIAPETVETAKSKGVNLLRTPLSSYEVCVRLSKLLGDS